MFGYTAAAYGQRTPIYFWHAMGGHLGTVLQEIVSQFNKSQSEYEVVADYKGNYTQLLTATAAAFRARQQPHLAHIFEVGTATMLFPKGIVKPLYQLMQEAGIEFNQDDFFPMMRGYYGDRHGNLLALPFNSSSPVLFYNKHAFRKAGLDENRPPRTWPEVASTSKKLLAAGYRCGFTTSWPSWIQLETFSAWHNIPFASQGNGFEGLDSRLIFVNPTVIKHVTQFAEWQKERIFQYGGRNDQALVLFLSEQCPMFTHTSGAREGLKKDATFEVGVAKLPFWPEFIAAPQNTLIGGGSLWALNGHNALENKGMAQFLKFLSSPQVQHYWQQKTGYLPITQPAYQYALKNKFYNRFPEAKIALEELNNNPPTLHSKGFRLGNYMRIREINNQALEAIWSGEQSTTEALQQAQAKGNLLLQRFERDVQ